MQTVESGKIALLKIDDNECDIKKIIYGSDCMELHSINSDCPAEVFTGNEMLRITIIGRVIQRTRDVSKILQNWPERQVFESGSENACAYGGI